jgi:hypothetical protein
MQVQDKTLLKEKTKEKKFKIDYLAQDNLNFLFVCYVLISPTYLLKGLLML